MCFFFNILPAFLGVQWREVHEEDPDRGSLYLAGQCGHEEASGQLAQTVCQHRSDQPMSTTPQKKLQEIKGEATVY